MENIFFYLSLIRDNKIFSTDEKTNIYSSLLTFDSSARKGTKGRPGT